MRAFDELDWLGRYFYDCLEIADMQAALNSGAVTSGSLVSHSTDFDDFEHFEQGLRRTPAERPTTGIPVPIKMICASLGRSNLPGHLDAAAAFLELPPKRRRSYAKRIRHATASVKKRGTAQAKVLSGDGFEIVCSVCGDDVEASGVPDPISKSGVKVGVHLLVRSDLNVLNLRLNPR